jgi:hypothetical protein
MVSIAFWVIHKARAHLAHRVFSVILPVVLAAALSAAVSATTAGLLTGWVAILIGLPLGALTYPVVLGLFAGSLLAREITDISASLFGGSPRVMALCRSLAATVQSLDLFVRPQRTDLAE